MDYKGLNFEIPYSVYLPDEDSFLLAESAKKIGNVLEIGCGSGLVSLAWAKKGNEVTGVDINEEAVKCSILNAEKNHISAKFFFSDLFSNVSGKFDAILFNPPYLPTTNEQKLAEPLNHAFDGGLDGRTVLDRFLNSFSSYLKQNGELFLIQSSLNNFESTKSILEDLGFILEIEKQDFFFEKLYLIRGMMT